MDTPALVFVATTLAIGGACLSYLKKKYRTTDHHLLLFVLVGSVGYLAPMQMTMTAKKTTEQLKQVWLGTARLYAVALERLAGKVAEGDLEGLSQALTRVTDQLGVDARDCVAATLVSTGPDGTQKQVSLPLTADTTGGALSEACALQAQATRESRQATWYEDRDTKGKLLQIEAIIPMGEVADSLQGVLVVEYAAEKWTRQYENAQWGVAGEFMGLMSICLVMGGVLVTNAEARRKRELERVTKPLIQELERLDGMVNAVQGVVWERQSGTGAFTIVSQTAEGYLGYALEQWMDEEGFLAKIIHTGDIERVRASWAEIESKPEAFHLEYHVVSADGSTAMVTEHGIATRDPLNGLVLRGIIVDVTAQREEEAEEQEMHKMMVEASRQAGMAEIATGVLHNVGNVLNSLNVGAKLLSERLRHSRLDKLCQATGLLKEHLPENMEFFVHDKRGRALPGYLLDLANYLREEQVRMGATVSDMNERIEHIRDMIMLQQSHSSVRTLWESLDLAAVMEDALRLEMDVHIAHQQVKIERHFADVPPVYLARGLLLQILVNLFSNACQAMSDKPADKRVLTLRIVPHGADRVRMITEDTGCGIHPRHLTNIFKQGFTTKRNGHGFGLHHACLLAQDLGGALLAESDGIGLGARFILDLPVRKAGPTTPTSSLAPQASQSASSTATLPLLTTA